MRLPYNNLFADLWNLEVLPVQVSKQVKYLIREGKLPKIRKLGLVIRRDAGCKLERPLASVHLLSHLQTLKIISVGIDHIISLPTFPETITKISLNGVNLDEGGMGVLEKLPKLWILKLRNCLFSLGRIHIRAESFPQLQYLQLRPREQIFDRWTQDEGAMPVLKHLVIDNLKVDMFPSRREGAVSNI
ncbi:hypothetical protein SLA2020_268900 [Shorea laevis]